jgi:hypothetical protein
MLSVGTGSALAISSAAPKTKGVAEGNIGARFVCAFAAEPPLNANRWQLDAPTGVASDDWIGRQILVMPSLRPAIHVQAPARSPFRRIAVLRYACKHQTDGLRMAS